MDIREVGRRQPQVRVEVWEMRASYNALIQLYAAMMTLALLGLAAWVAH